MQPVQKYVNTYLGTDSSIAEQFRSLTRVIEQLVSFPLRGNVTFATAATATVTLTRPLKTANYEVFVTGDKNETFWVTGKTTTQFTINSSAAGSTAKVSWLLY